ncbi:ketopantoate reductase family protein [Chloroflexota bacterium]
MVQPLKILSIGAGAIGTYVGGSLALRGHEVVFLEQLEAARSMKGQSLRLLMHDVEHNVSDPTVVGSLDEALMLGPYDVALFALKSYDTPAALESFTPFADRVPPFLCLSNGVENEEAIAAAFGPNKVVTGTVTTAIGRRGIGNIVLERLRGIGVAAGHPLSATLVEAMDDAGLQAQLFPNAQDLKWSKMLTNLISNALSAILDMPPAEIFSHPGLYYLEIQQLRECLQVMKAQGIKVVNLPGTPVKSLAFAVKSLPLWLSKPLIGKAVGGGRGDKMPSFHIDLHSERGKSEVGYLNGAVVRRGEQLNIPTPANLLLNQTLTALTMGHEDIETYRKKPEVLLAEL